VSNRWNFNPRIVVHFPHKTRLGINRSGLDTHFPSLYLAAPSTSFVLEALALIQHHLIKRQVMEAQDTGAKPTVAAQADSSQLSRASSLEKQPPTDGGHLAAVETEDVVYPSGAKVAVIMFSLYISIFLVALDRTIIATAIPRITDEFHSIDVSIDETPGELATNLIRTLDGMALVIC
jgi:hypothetical protein